MRYPIPTSTFHGTRFALAEVAGIPACASPGAFEASLNALTDNYTPIHVGPRAVTYILTHWLAEREGTSEPVYTLTLRRLYKVADAPAEAQSPDDGRREDRPDR